MLSLAINDPFDSAPRGLADYTEDELIGMAGSILAEPHELTEMNRACLDAINSEMIVRVNRIPQRMDA
jgi:hypothetical protein